MCFCHFDIFLKHVVLLNTYRGKSTKSKECKQVTHCRDEQLLNFLHGSLEFYLSTVLWVFDCDEHMQVLVQMLPVGLSTVLLLLYRLKDGRACRHYRLNQLYISMPDAELIFANKNIFNTWVLTGSVAMLLCPHVFCMLLVINFKHL